MTATQILRKSHYPSVPDVDRLQKGATWTQAEVCDLCGLSYPPPDVQKYQLSRLRLISLMERMIEETHGVLYSIRGDGPAGGVSILEDREALIFNASSFHRMRRLERKTVKRVASIDPTNFDADEKRTLEQQQLESALRIQDTQTRKKRIEEAKRLEEPEKKSIDS